MNGCALLGGIRRPLLAVVMGATVGGLPACGGGGGGGGGGSSGPQLVANNGCSYADLNQEFTGMLSGRDSSGAALSYSILTNPSKGSVTLSNALTGEFRYTPNNNSRGTDSFTFRVSNGQTTADATYRVVYTPRIMPLGDSIVWGVTLGAANPQQPPLGQRVSFRKPLRDALGNAGYHIDYVGTLQAGGDPGFLAGDAEHEGHGGWTADNLVDGNPSPDPGTGSGRLADWLNATQPDVVLLHIGTNDLNGAGDNSDQWPDIERILTTINNWESGHWPVTVVVSRIIQTNPPRAETTSYNNNVINFAVNPHIASGDQVIWVDMENALSVPGDYADQLHPNASGYQKMANLWLWPLAGTGTASGNYSGPGILPRCQ